MDLSSLMLECKQDKQNQDTLKISNVKSGLDALPQKQTLGILRESVEGLGLWRGAGWSLEKAEMGWGQDRAGGGHRLSGRELTKNTSSKVSSREQLNLRIPSWRSGHFRLTRLHKKPA